MKPAAELAGNKGERRTNGDVQHYVCTDNRDGDFGRLGAAAGEGNFSRSDAADDCDPDDGTTQVGAGSAPQNRSLGGGVHTVEPVPSAQEPAPERANQQPGAGGDV